MGSPSLNLHRGSFLIVQGNVHTFCIFVCPKLVKDVRRWTSLACVHTGSLEPTSPTALKKIQLQQEAAEARPWFTSTHHWHESHLKTGLLMADLNCPFSRVD